MSAKTSTLPGGPSAARAFFTPRWLLTTLLVILAAAVMVRLGIWQLDRLEQRRVRNAQYQRVMALPPLDLNQPLSPADLSGAVYRDAVVTGRYDFEAEVVLRNQVWDDRPGYHLLTPLVIDSTGQAVLVDRGWIPLEDGSPQSRAAYTETGLVSVRGRLMPQQQETKIGGAVDPALTAGQISPGCLELDQPRAHRPSGQPAAPAALPLSRTRPGWLISDSTQPAGSGPG